MERVSNEPPVANAGPDQSVTISTLVTLDGTGSYDPAGNTPITYAWSITTRPAGCTAVLSSTTAAKPTFTPDKTGDYIVSLTVTDSLGLSSTTPDTVKVTATTSGPIATIVKIFPKTLNLGSKGYFLAFVTLPDADKGATIDMKTVSCSGAPAVRMMRNNVRGSYKILH